MKTQLICSISLSISVLCWGCASADQSQDSNEKEDLLESQDPMIFGTDDRTDVYLHLNATLVDRAKNSTAAIVLDADVNTSNPNNIVLQRGPFKKAA